MELPKVELPKIELPKIELPKVELPNIDFPNIELPNLELPHLPQPKPRPVRTVTRRSLLFQEGFWRPRHYPPVEGAFALVGVGFAAVFDVLLLL